MGAEFEKQLDPRTNSGKRGRETIVDRERAEDEEPRASPEAKEVRDDVAGSKEGHRTERAGIDGERSTVMRVRTTPSPTRSTQTTPSALSITSTTRGSSSKSVSGPSALLSALARLAWLSDSSGWERGGTSVHQSAGPKCCAKSTGDRATVRGSPPERRGRLRRAACFRVDEGRWFGRSGA